MPRKSKALWFVQPLAGDTTLDERAFSQMEAVIKRTLNPPERETIARAVSEARRDALKERNPIFAADVIKGLELVSKPAQRLANQLQILYLKSSSGTGSADEQAASFLQIKTSTLNLVMMANSCRELANSSRDAVALARLYPFRTRAPRTWVKNLIVALAKSYFDSTGKPGTKTGIARSVDGKSTKAGQAGRGHSFRL